jgi:radical SAM protein with 4Fe4S-binding SPASM domain
VTVSVEGPALEIKSINAYDEIVAKTQQQHRLFAAHWELTYRCNVRCSHCYLDVLPAQANVPDELTTAECLSLVDALAALGALNLTFSGGEVFTRRDFFEIAEYARTKRFLLRIFTNGIAITPELADRIATLHPYAVEISLYGASAETHEQVTRYARSFELTTQALRLLRERGVRTVIKTVLMRHNVHELNALKALAEELGAQFRFDITITPKDSGMRAPLEHRLSYDDLVWLFRETFAPVSWSERTVRLDQPTCGIASNALLIDPVGNIFPCVQVRIPIGNVRARSLQDMWQASPVWKELAHLHLNQLPVCRTCELRTLCVRCHGLAQLEDGDLRGPASSNCFSALARRQVLVEKGVLPTDYPVPEHLRA